MPGEPSLLITVLHRFENAARTPQLIDRRVDRSTHPTGGRHGGIGVLLERDLLDREHDDVAAEYDHHVGKFLVVRLPRVGVAPEGRKRPPAEVVGQSFRRRQRHRNLVVTVHAAARDATRSVLGVPSPPGVAPTT